MSKKIVHVAAAVIYDREGRVLLGQRAPGTFYPGYWEFPGGKVEAGETPYDALVRELGEELGIRVITAWPWLHKEHVYEHAHVHLHFFRVTEWEGEPRDHVHSALDWQTPDAFTVSPMLPANGPILKSLGLPDFYAITNAAKTGVDGQLLALANALENGLKLVQIREPGLDPARRAAFAHAAVDLCHQYGARALVNGDEILARDCGADGVHMPARQLMVATQRPDFPWVAASCHTAAELAQAVALGLDFVVVGSVRPTTTHPDQTPLGWDGFDVVAADSPLPVFALGGMTREDREEAWRHGAQGIAAIRGAWD